MTSHTYNLKDISTELADQFGLTQANSADLVRFVFDRIAQELADGKQVRLHKFGTLSAKQRAEGVARNPMTGAHVVVPSRRVVRLTPSPLLKKQVNAK